MSQLPSVLFNFLPSPPPRPPSPSPAHFPEAIFRPSPQFNPPDEGHETRLYLGAPTLNSSGEGPTRPRPGRRGSHRVAGAPTPPSRRAAVHGWGLGLLAGTGQGALWALRTRPGIYSEISKNMWQMTYHGDWHFDMSRSQPNRDGHGLVHKPGPNLQVGLTL